jgi:6-phosphogluconolactonase (cycloisomerase 2 family)
LIVSNYGNGTVACFAVEPDGSLRAQPQWVAVHVGASHCNEARQEQPHCHMALPCHSGILVTDLGQV